MKKKACCFKRFLVYGFIASAIFLKLNATYADTVTLNNGRAFEGVIKQENQHEVVLELGLGSITLRRSKIAKIQYSEDNNKIEQNWQQQYVTSGKYTPVQLTGLADKFRSLSAERMNAVQAQNNNSELNRLTKKHVQQVAQLKEKQLKIAVQLKSTPVSREHINRYNQLVSQQNKIHSDLVLLRSKIIDNQNKAHKNQQQISRYATALNAFEKDMQQALQSHQNLDGNDKAAVFLNQVSSGLDVMNKEFRQFSIPHQKHADHLIVEARLNGNVSGSFLLDTGASVITLSMKIAKQLGLSLSENNTTQVTLANGVKETAFPVLLQSVQVGKAKAHNVMAVVLPQSSEQGFDGLLGMSFLKEFIMQLHPSDNRLILTKFKPH